MKVVIDTDRIKDEAVRKAKEAKRAGVKAINGVKARAENLASLNKRKVVTCPHCGNDHVV